MTGAYVHTVASMGTVVTFQVTGHDASAREDAVARAAEWFVQIERACTRFDQNSEVSRLASAAGTPVRVSAMVLEVVRFAIAVAEETNGAFDPTLGRGASYRDVIVDADASTILLRKPLVLDLGAVAKGLAVDMAARELAPLDHFAIDAGGDLYLGGFNTSGAPWSIGIRHPRRTDEMIDRLDVSGLAVCTSGDYERGDHIIDPRTGASAPSLASVTVLTSSAMVADALGTAAFVLGPVDGLALLERHGVDGLLVTPTLQRLETRGFHRHRRPEPSIA